MKKEITDLSMKELKRGFHSVSAGREKYICNYCQKEFCKGEVYPVEGHFYDYKLGAREHVRAEHGGLFELLITGDSKYLSLTDNQKKLLTLMASGLSDNEIARQLKVTPSTVRHQKFMFREKAKQARMFLSVYELAEEQNKREDKLVPVHSKATMVDDRYITTEEEKEKVLTTAFSSLEPLKLIRFPAREKKKIVVLKKITESFKEGKHYEEREVNRILKDIYDDYPTIRRYLIEYGFMSRTDDCKEYWLT